MNRLSTNKPMLPFTATPTPEQKIRSSQLALKIFEEEKKIREETRRQRQLEEIKLEEERRKIEEENKRLEDEEEERKLEAYRRELLSGRKRTKKEETKEIPALISGTPTYRKREEEEDQKRRSVLELLSRRISRPVTSVTPPGSVTSVTPPPPPFPQVMTIPSSAVTTLPITTATTKAKPSITVKIKPPAKVPTTARATAKGSEGKKKKPEKELALQKAINILPPATIGALLGFKKKQLDTVYEKFNAIKGIVIDKSTISSFSDRQILGDLAQDVKNEPDKLAQELINIVRTESTKETKKTKRSTQVETERKSKKEEEAKKRFEETSRRRMRLMRESAPILGEEKRTGASETTSLRYGPPTLTPTRISALTPTLTPTVELKVSMAPYSRSTEQLFSDTKTIIDTYNSNPVKYRILIPIKVLGIASGAAGETRIAIYPPNIGSGLMSGRWRVNFEEKEPIVFDGVVIQPSSPSIALVPSKVLDRFVWTGEIRSRDGKYMIGIQSEPELATIG